MFLFLPDWVDQSVTVDLETNNVSFIKMAQTLGEMGIQNNKFFLALHDPDLKGVDPHNLKDSSTELRLRIARECKVNYWYFIREVVRIKAEGGTEPSPFVLNRANLAASWCFLNNTHFMLTIPRQIGKTILTMVITDWMFDIVADNSDIGLFTKNSKLVVQTVSRLRSIRDNLPPYLVTRRSDDTVNKEGLGNATRGNNLYTSVPQGTDVEAMEQGRGSSFIYFIIDEFAWYRRNWLAYTPIKIVTDAAQQHARDAGLRVSNMLVTSAGRLETDPGIFAHKVKANAHKFTERLYDCENRDELTNIVKNNSGNNMFYLEFSALQLGKTEEWLRDKERECTTDIEFQTEYMNKWVQASIDPPLSKHVLDAIHKLRFEPVTTTSIESLMINWYTDPSRLDKNMPLVMGNDTSDNVSCDFTTLVATDPVTLATIFTLRCNKENLTYAARCIVHLMKEWTGLVIIPERNKNGAFMIDILIDVLRTEHRRRGDKFDPLRRIFNSYHQDGITIPDDYDLNNGAFRKKFGFTTGAGSRAILFNNILPNAVTKCMDRIKDSILIDEIRSLEKKPGGKIEAADGAHDDMVISWLLSLYFCMHGRNLGEYGISPSTVLSQVGLDGKLTKSAVEKEETIQRANRLKEIRAKLENKSLHASIRNQLENELRVLERLVPEEDVDSNIFSPTQLQATKTQEKETQKRNDPSFSAIYSQQILNCL